MRYTPHPRPYLIGCGVRSDDPETFLSLSKMVKDGLIDHIQVLVIPEPSHVFNTRAEVIASEQVPVILHAPHHNQGVNPCCPEISGTE